MKIFEDSTFTWWQIGMFKWSVFTIGLLLGAYYQEWVMMLLYPIAFIAIVSTIYISMVWYNQHKK